MSDTPTGGTLVIAQPVESEPLIPPVMQQVQSKVVADQIFDPLAAISPSLDGRNDRTFAPRLSDGWSWSDDSLRIAFHIDADARWHDGAPVRAEDVRFTWELYTDTLVASPHASRLAEIDSVTVQAPDSAIFWFSRRYPGEFYDAVHHMLILPSHLLASADRATIRQHPFGRDPVGSGRFRLTRWLDGQLIEVSADTSNYRGRPPLDRVIFSITPQNVAAATRAFTGEVDLAEQLTPATLRELPKHPDYTLVRYPGFDYVFVRFNLRDPRDRNRPHPLFADRALRRALTMAVDRTTIVRATFDSLAAPSVGPMTRAQPMADTSVAQIPYNADAARALLDSLGWRDADGDGVRERGGQPLRFSVLVPNVSGSRMRTAVPIQEALRLVGVRMDIEAIEPQAWMQRTYSGRFDASFDAAHTEPNVSGLEQNWGSAERADGNGDDFNFGRYSSASFDAELDSALAARNDMARRAHLQRAYQAVVDDAPAIWVYEVIGSFIVHRRFQRPAMRPDAWWTSIADWSIPADERIPRDRLAPTADAP